MLELPIRRLVLVLIRHHVRLFMCRLKLSPPEPPNPPDSPFQLVLLRLFDTSSTVSQMIYKSLDLDFFLLNMDFVSVGVVSLVSVGDTSFASKHLLSTMFSQRFSNLFLVLC